MAVFYLDTSVIVKRYRTEEGTKFMDVLWSECLDNPSHKLATSSLAVLEFVAAMRRLQKAKIISKEDLGRSIFVFSKDMENLSLRPLEEDIISKGLNLVMDHGLRTADALHLAIVIELREMMRKMDEEVILISSDKEMCEAATNESVKVISPSDDSIDELRSILKWKIE